MAKIQFGRLTSETLARKQPPPLFTLDMGLLKSKPLFVIKLVDVLAFLHLLYPNKVFKLPKIMEGLWYIVSGNHRFEAGIRLKIQKFWVRILVVQPGASWDLHPIPPMTAQILQFIEMSDNVIDTKTFTNVTTLQKILHLAEIVQCYFNEHQRTPNYIELQQQTLLDFKDH